MITRSLWEMESGDAGVILVNPGDCQVTQRLAELGLAAGEHVEVVQHGPSMMVMVGSSLLCLRHDRSTPITVACAAA